MSTDNATSDDLQLGDYLVDTSNESSGEALLRLIRCPICHDNLRELSLQKIHSHIGEHTPEEAGLTNYPTKGVDFDLSAYALAEPILLDALGVDIDPAVYHPLVAVHEEVVEAIVDNQPTWSKEIAEATGEPRGAVNKHTRELEAAGWLTFERGRNGRKLYSVAVGGEEVDV